MTERQIQRIKKLKKKERRASLISHAKTFIGAFAITLGLALLMSFTSEIESQPVDSDALTVTLEQNELTKPSDLQNAMTADQFQPTYNNLQGGLVRR